MADFKPRIYLDLVPHLVPLDHTIVSDPFVKNAIWLILAATLVWSSDGPWGENWTSKSRALPKPISNHSPRALPNPQIHILRALPNSLTRTIQRSYHALSLKGLLKSLPHSEGLTKLPQHQHTHTITRPLSGALPAPPLLAHLGWDHSSNDRALPNPHQS